MKCVALLLLGLAMACQSSNFKGKGTSGETPSADDNTISTGEVAIGESTMPTLPAGALIDAHTINLKVDVVFAIDTSGSMDDELVATQTNLPKLIKTLDSGRLDSRIHLLLDQAIAVPADVDAQKIALVKQKVNSTDAISRLTNLFSGTYAANYQSTAGAALPQPLAFRKDAKLEVIVISDDNGRGAGNLAADFDPAKALKATFNAIVGLPTSVPSATCSVENVGTEYTTLAQASMGSVLDICSADWSALLVRLSTDIVKRSVTFTLSKEPANPKEIVVKLQDVALSPENWTYDAASNSVTLLKTDTVKDGSTIGLAYVPKS